MRHLLTAKVRWQKGEGAQRIRVTPELVEIAAQGAPTTRWQQTYDAELADLFAIQGEIATRVASVPARKSANESSPSPHAAFAR